MTGKVYVCGGSPKTGTVFCALTKEVMALKNKIKKGERDTSWKKARGRRIFYRRIFFNFSFPIFLSNL